MSSLHKVLIKKHRFSINVLLDSPDLAINEDVLGVINTKLVWKSGIRWQCDKSRHSKNDFLSSARLSTQTNLDNKCFLQWYLCLGLFNVREMIILYAIIDLTEFREPFTFNRNYRSTYIIVCSSTVHIRSGCNLKDTSCMKYAPAPITSVDINNSEQRYECIDFTMIITNRNNTLISNLGGRFRWLSEYPWCIIQFKFYDKCQNHENLQNLNFGVFKPLKHKPPCSPTIGNYILG
ncbi:hypothetical protein AGLY_004756 [Aphis glycines]|uniref:Uncharacterized protein n=1 Tax=Aphis glycines TaxID=307491 RepID=A0A6G0TV70_APHGL|nr:hypothetical protein AGLY_004756 [Aphis glycines]